MNDFDKMMRELSGKIDIPEGYNSMIDDVLKSLPDKEQTVSHSKWKNSNRIIGFVICGIALVFVLGVSTLHANANILDTFRMTIMDIFHIGMEDGSGKSAGNMNDTSGGGDGLGIQSREEGTVAKKDLMIELKETVIDAHGIYALIKITAPADIVFEKNISFDYFAFCEGENYNADNVIGGVTDCYMLERLASRPNEAVYVIDITGDISEYAGKRVSASFKDLTVDPNDDDNRNVLVEGMWTVSFEADITVRENINIDGELLEKEDITFSYINTTASIVSIDMSPLGIAIVSDVSNMPFDELGISDTTIGLRIRMADGREYLVSPYEEDDNYIVESGESQFDQRNGGSYQTDIYSFVEPIDINSVTGFYVQDIFVPAH